MGFYLDIFKGVGQKLLCVKYILEAARHSYSEFAIRNILLWGIRSFLDNKLQERGKVGFPFGRF
jgi:hypothetical protein